MRILVLDEEFPWPLNTGKRIRSYNLIHRLARKHEVHYVAYGHEEEESFRHFKSNQLNPIAIRHKIQQKSGPLFYVRLMLNLFSRYPYIVQSHFSSVFATALQDAIAQIQPQILLCEWTPYAVFARNLTGIPVIVSAHNIETRIWERYLTAEKSPFRRWYIGQQVAKVQRFESETFAKVQGVTAVSPIEAQDIKSIAPRCTVEVVDNGVDLAYFQPTGSKPSQTSSAVFTGSMDWRPNQDAAVFFCKDILPIIKKQSPEFSVTFVGRTPPQHIMELQRIPGVTVTGTVDDVRPYIENSPVYIVPLRIGGGSRLKILEALAMKRAIVSTTVGAEGLELNDNEHLLIADTPNHFAETVLKLTADESLRQRLGDAGRAMVEKQYGWDSLAERLEKFLLRAGNQ